MAWENVIVGYEIKVFESKSVIPIGSSFLRHERKPVWWTSNFGDVCHWIDNYYYQVPIYKKMNIKRK